MPLNAAANAKIDSPVDIQPATDAEPLVIEPAACVNKRQNGVLTQAEALCKRIKPIKEIAGHVRSPQGFAIKIVNDHVMKIAAWLGYAIDSLGSLKNKAMDHVKTRARTALGLDLALTLAMPATSTKVTPANGYINIGLIPLETNI